MAQMKKFQDFLEQVQQQNSDEFQENPEIVSRYHTLNNSNKDLLEKNKQLEA